MFDKNYDLYFLKSDPDDLYIDTYEFSKDQLIQDYESLVWTERYSDVGDFKLTLKASKPSLDKFMSEYWIACDASDKIMRIDNAIVYGAGPKRGLMEINGKAIENVFEHRFVDGVEPGVNTIVSTPANFIATLLSPTIPGTLESQRLPEMRIHPNRPLGTSAVQASSPGTILSAIKTVAQAHDLGFKVYLDRAFSDARPLTFYIYRGIDRSKDQSVVKPVEFSALDGTLADTTFMISRAPNDSAIILYNDWFKLGYAGDGRSYYDGNVYRQFKIVDLSSKEFDNPTSQATKDKLTAIAVAELKADGFPQITLLDGTPTNIPGSPVYGVDYFLGDLVSVSDEYGNVGKKRVTEHILSIDKNGVREYPTFKS